MQPANTPEILCDSVPQPITPACNPADIDRYHTALKEWDACKYCARQGYASKQVGPQSWTCDLSKPKANAYGACLCGPVDPCHPFLKPPVNEWERLQPYAKGTVVHDPQYGEILYGYWNEKMGRPLLAIEAPYLRQGRCTAGLDTTIA